MFPETQLIPHPNEKFLDSEIMKKAEALHKRENYCRQKALQLAAKHSAIMDIYTRTRHWLHIIDNSLSEGVFKLTKKIPKRTPG